MSTNDDRDIIQEYDEGTVVYRRLSENPEDNLGLPDMFFVETPEGRTFEFSQSGRWANRRRSLLMGELCDKVPEMMITEDPRTIPTNVAIIGKPAMAAYLSAVHNTRRQRIADYLKISRDTVRQYLSDFRNSRR